MTDKQSAVRLALRVEGDFWVAYCAQVGTMDGAFELGRIAMRLVQDEDRKLGFMALMQAGMEHLIKVAFGVTPEKFEITSAPEHERAGRA